jgi:hypothetical protein
MAKLKLQFPCAERDSQDGSAAWEIWLYGRDVGRIDKDVVWCGDGYRADSYSVSIDVPGEDESREATFGVANVWNKGGMTAPQALAACKAFAREAITSSGTLDVRFGCGPHRQVTVAGPWGRIHCDEGVAEAVRLCLRAGLRTWASCQWTGGGAEGFKAYINPHGPAPGSEYATDGAIDSYRTGTAAEMARAIGLLPGEWASLNGVLWFTPFLRVAPSHGSNHRHRPHPGCSTTVAFRGQVAWPGNRAAHGDTLVIAVCTCGAVRLTNVNGQHIERGKWKEGQL